MDKKIVVDTKQNQSNVPIDAYKVIIGLNLFKAIFEKLVSIKLKLFS